MVKNLITKAELSRRKGVTGAAITKVIKNGLHVAMIGKRIDTNHSLVVKYLNDVDDSPAANVDPLYEKAVNICREKNKFNASIISRSLVIGYPRAKKILAMMHAVGTDKQPIKKGKVAPPPPPISPGIAHLSGTKKQHSLKALNNVETGTTLHQIPEDILAFVDMTLRELIQRFGTDVAFLDWLKATKSIEDINEKRLKNAVTRGDLVNRGLIKNWVIDPVNSAHIKLLTDGAKTINRRVRTMAIAGRSEKETEEFIIDQISSFIKPMKVKITKALRDA